MHLKQIKLAGFKSFVDPTTVSLLSNRVAVVGPNGSGKSNIIDAVRWVMGESSAKYLRGESITDVIFNGSTARKPVGQASIELIFDNTDGTLTGEYAGYANISIRRQVDRDGVSQYFLNNSRCRRKDILDVFLGTGLGARSYSIIEQDTISRLIEAKPDELRIYLEEAAGISKYKERRKETETRIQHSKENLERLNDVRQEVDKQLEHLQRQAKAAERYQVLKQEERLTRAQLLALRWQGLEQQTQQQYQALQQHELQLEALVTEQRSIDTSLEQQRVLQADYAEEFNQVQAGFYSISNDIARFEQTLQHNRERRQQLEADYARITTAITNLQTTKINDAHELQQLESQQQTLAPQLSTLQEHVDTAKVDLTEWEQRLHQWQQAWDEFNQSCAQTNQQFKVDETHKQHLLRQLSELESRLTRLEEECGKVHFAEIETEITTFKQAILTQEDALEQNQDEMGALQEKMQVQQQDNQQVSVALDAYRLELQQLQGRLASLETLQQAALGQNNQEVMQWLYQHELNKKPRLAQILSVESGWELAVETVLGSYLEAVCVSTIASEVATDIAKLPNGSVTLLDTSAQSMADKHTAAETLLSKVTCEYAVENLLAGIYVANNLDQALSLSSSLTAYESIITADGIWLGNGWLRVAKGHNDRVGILRREQDLNDLKQRIEHTQEQIHEQEDLMQSGREHLQSLQTQRNERQRQMDELVNQLRDLKTQLQIKQNYLEQQQQRFSTMSQELLEQQQRRTQQQTELAAIETRVQQAQQQLETESLKREELQQQRGVLWQHIEEKKQLVNETTHALHETNLKLQALANKITALQQNIQREESQLESLETQRMQAAEILQNLQLPQDDVQQQLEVALNRRIEMEQLLSIARDKVTALEQEVRVQNKQRSQVEQDCNEARTRLERTRLEHQSLEVRATAVQEQLVSSEHAQAFCKAEQPIGIEQQVEATTAEEDVQELVLDTVETQPELPPLMLDFSNYIQSLLENITGGLTEKDLELQLETLVRKIERLGAINLAAIDEYKTLAERKTYLDEQNTDLCTALTTLEDAIRKIDKETRTRFKETFDKVNDQFKALFPHIFNGGSAYLELTGEDLLATGVTVMACPPGKRNSTIHLLSGGEKALTALALVFAIFQLNPAPFCMLDEVDAPLDDANVGRFCNLVKEMSKTVQFIFISHNKLAIEMADHLIGVTMREPGVSRLVSVDIEAAVAMAE